ncbi:ketopantoate reductase family protein [Mangrovicoccus ximenensis]|uniref:ketopantoate reductase family protein n=1 Tax=Mangrovicoccus ximenensis TaxID=1911570 RepID=UPI000D3ABB8F|nr:2-dehydropantoate 2-reductase [Mangrovicoccus ximenensis]
MKAIIYGAGALGCFFGARLQQGGHDVTFIARGAHLEALQRHGLRVESSSGDFCLEHVDATSEIAHLTPADLIFFAVKNYDVAASAAAMAGLVGPGTAILTVQNGVWAQPHLAAAFGAQRVLPGVVMMPAEIKEPGVIRTPAEAELGGITFGPYEGGSSELGARMLAAFAQSGVPATLSDDIWQSLWKKFIPLSSYAAITAATRLNIGAIRETEVTRALLKSLIGETASVARASHGTVPGDAGQSAFDMLMGLPPHLHASMLGDLLRGRRIELEWLSGEVIRRGRELGIATPSHQFAYAVLAPYANGRPEGSP